MQHDYRQFSQTLNCVVTVKANAASSQWPQVVMRSANLTSFKLHTPICFSFSELYSSVPIRGKLSDSLQVSLEQQKGFMQLFFSTYAAVVPRPVNRLCLKISEALL